jgi:hypothetical protein
MMNLVIVAAAAAFTAASPVDVGAIEREIATACDASPAIDVNWQSFGDDDDAMSALSGSRLSFLSAAFASVCKNPSLKPEVGKQIAKIVIAQAHGAADPVIYLTQKTLYVEYLWVKGEPAPDASFVAAEIAARLRGDEADAP